MAKSKEELKSLLMKVKKESEKAGLKLNIQKMKIMASSPIISWQTDGETMETVRVFIFLGSKITVDGDLSHEIKRWLLVGRKTMTNLDSILKSRDITLRINVHLVKAMVFPVVMYGSESLTIKKAEHRRIDAFELWCWRRLLRVPWTTRRSNWLILKEICPEYLLEGPMLKLNLQYSGYLMWKALANTLYKVFFQYFGHLMWRLISKDPDSGKERRQEAKGKTEDEMVRWHHWLNGHEFEQVLEDGEGQGSLECCSPRGHKELDTPEWTTTKDLRLHLRLHRCNRHELEQTLGDGEGQGRLVCCSPWSHKELDVTGWLNNKYLIILAIIESAYESRGFFYSSFGFQWLAWRALFNKCSRNQLNLNVRDWLI